MIFEILYDSWVIDRLLLIEGGMCVWSLRKRDNVFKILEIFSTKKGSGTRMVNILKEMAVNKNCPYIELVCPTNLKSNSWWPTLGFVPIDTQVSKRGRESTIYRWYPEGGPDAEQTIESTIESSS